MHMYFATWIDTTLPLVPLALKDGVIFHAESHCSPRRIIQCRDFRAKQTTETEEKENVIYVLEKKSTKKKGIELKPTKGEIEHCRLKYLSIL